MKPKKRPIRQSHSKRTWRKKFSDAFLGLRQSVRRQSSYPVHFTAAALVICTGIWLGFDTIRWSILILCITMVIGCEILNTSIETMAKAITTSYNPLIGRSLNIASGAVLLFSFGAAVVGIILFAEALLRHIM